MVEPLAYDWDDSLLEEVRSERRLRYRAYRPGKTAVVLGRGSKIDLEINLETVLQDGVALLRRRGGGCSVVLDTGNLIVSAALPLPGFGGIRHAFRNISNWLISALNRSGIPEVRQEGTSDLALGDRKIGGACIYRTRNLLYYSTTLLYSPQIELVEKYLKHPPREPLYRAERSHRDFMGSLVGLAQEADIDKFANEIDDVLSKTLADLELSLARNNNRNTKHEVLT